jgi:predicted Zn finger-like uncharacterized protein
MSLATRCTSCGTIFRVVQDQLKVSEGWVRCGRCQKVFNALEALFDLEREFPPQRTAPVATVATTDIVARGVSEFVSSRLPPLEPDTRAELPSTHEDDSLESRFLTAPREPEQLSNRRTETQGPPEFEDARFPDEPTSGDATPYDADGNTEDADTATAASPDARPTPLLERWRARRAARQAQAAVPEPVVAHGRAGPREVPTAPATTAGIDPSWAAAAPGDTPDDSSLMDTRVLFADESMLVGDLPDPQNAADEQARLAELAELVGTASPGRDGVTATPAFVRAAENAERWHRPRVRASLAIAAALLLGLLTMQVAVQFRDSFAARWPQARPTLVAMCEWLGCEIRPLKRVAALSVDASGLSPAAASDSYRLLLTLHNRDQVELATPSVELSLTDSRGTLISRRTLDAADFRHAPDGGLLGVSLPPGTDTQIQTVFAISGPRVSGYTVELFYP